MEMPACIQKNVSLKQYNTWKVGGIADYLSLPESVEDVAASVQWALENDLSLTCLLYTSPSPRDRQKSRMPSSA